MYGLQACSLAPLLMMRKLDVPGDDFSVWRAGSDCSAAQLHLTVLYYISQYISQYATAIDPWDVEVLNTQPRMLPRGVKGEEVAPRGHI
jgi:hypothetical protein